MTAPGTPPSDSAPPSWRRAPLHRATNRFLSDPSSARNAVIVIVIADMAAVTLGALVIWLLDRKEYEEFTTALWYILQTVTTVGYGDVTPTEGIGRLIGGVVMLLAIASLSILTASITSAFIDARQAARRDDDATTEDARWAALAGRLDAVIERLDRLERRDGVPGPVQSALGAPEEPRA